MQSKHIKILFPVSKFYPVQSGGPIYTLLWHCSGLNEKNNDVYIISSDSGFNTINEDVPEKNKWLSKKYGKIIYFGGFNKIWKQLQEVLKQAKDSDVVHLNSFFSPVSFLSFILLKLNRFKGKIIWSIRGEFNENALKYSRYKKKPILLLVKGMTRDVLFHSTSFQETEEISNVLGDREVLMLPNYMELHQPLNIRKEKTLLFMGRIHPIKCIDRIIMALTQSKAFLKNDYNFVIAGTYEDRHREYYDQLVELTKEFNLTDKISFVGHVIGEVKQNLYARSMFLLLLSETENFGNVVIEALNEGTPAITSLNTPWEDLPSYKAGFHISNDPHTIASTIDLALSMNKEEYSIYSMNARKLAQKKYDIKEGIQKWARVYNTRIIN